MGIKRMLVFLVVVLTLILSSCSEIEIPENIKEEVRQETQKYTEEQKEVIDEDLAQTPLDAQYTTVTGKNLLEVARGTAIDVYIKYEVTYSATQQTTIQNNISNAILQWLEPLRTMPDGNLLTRNVNFTTSSSAGEVRITLSATVTRSYHNSDCFITCEKSTIVMANNKHFSFKTYLHEFGHAFELGDTYIEDVWSCKASQYSNSVMCQDPAYAAVTDLTADDVRGVRYNYCRVWQTCSSNDYLDFYLWGQ
ncbi:MAG: hypothetical protein ACRCYY_09880 [Trueperaceae bacterium]